MHPAIRLFICLSLLMAPHAASAMRFVFRPASEAGTGVLVASGEVKPGDDELLRRALGTLPRGTRLTGLALDSPGGALEEGFRLAATVHAAQLQTIVDQGATCASACVLLFAAGSHLFASSTALVGVHSAGYAHLDTTDAQAATIQLARHLAEYGVPDAILGKMVTAHPSQIWWLTRQELESMRVTLNVQEAKAVPVRVDLPEAAAAPAQAPVATQTASVKPGYRVEPATRGFQVAPAATGFHVWRPGTPG